MKGCIYTPLLEYNLTIVDLFVIRSLCTMVHEKINNTSLSRN